MRLTIEKIIFCTRDRMIKILLSRYKVGILIRDELRVFSELLLALSFQIRISIEFFNKSMYTGVTLTRSYKRKVFHNFT